SDLSRAGCPTWWGCRTFAVEVRVAGYTAFVSPRVSLPDQVGHPLRWLRLPSTAAGVSQCLCQAGPSCGLQARPGPSWKNGRGAAVLLRVPELASSAGAPDRGPGAHGACRPEGHPGRSGNRCAGTTVALSWLTHDPSQRPGPLPRTRADIRDELPDLY